MPLTLIQLLANAQVIYDEHGIEENTQVRVGQMLKDIIEYIQANPGGGGAPSRFGVTGEDTTATASRTFHFGGHTFNIDDALSMVLAVFNLGLGGVGTALNLIANDTSIAQVDNASTLVYQFVKPSDKQGTFKVPLTVNDVQADNAGNIIIPVGPGGADTQVQFNDGGAFGGGEELIWDKDPSDNFPLRQRLGIGYPLVSVLKNSRLSINGVITEDLDPEEIDNGNFEGDLDGWDTGGGTWTYLGPNSAVHTPGSANTLFWPGDVMAGETYRVRFTKTGAPGDFSLIFGGFVLSNIAGGAYDLYREVSETYVSDGRKISFLAQSSYSGTVSAVSVQRVLKTAIHSRGRTYLKDQSTRGEGILGVENDGKVIFSEIIKRVKITVSSAELSNLSSAAKLLLVNPGPGKMHHIIDVVANYKYGTTDYSVSSDITIKYPGSASDVVVMVECIEGIANKVSFYPLTTLFQDSDTVLIDNSIYLASATDPTLGDGTLDIYLTYTTINTL